MTADNSCFTYAATAYRAVPNSPRDVIASGIGLCPPSSRLWPWFEWPKPAMPFARPNLGDFIAWADKRHVAVGTGDGDLVIQYGYDVRNLEEARRLRQLIGMTRGTLPKTGSWQADLDGWTVGKNTVSLALLREAHAATSTNVQICTLKPNAFDYIDPLGPLGYRLPCTAPPTTYLQPGALNTKLPVSTPRPGGVRR